jgi:hypothetical protein
MEHKQIKSLLFLGGLFLFHLLFWKETIGLNSLLFSGLSVGFLAYNFPEARGEKAFWMSSVGTVLLAAMITVHHSSFALVVWMMSWLMMVGLATIAGLQEVLYGFLQGLGNLLALPNNWSAKFSIRKNNHKDYEEFVPENATGLRPSLFALPLVIVLIFISLYSVGNQNFAQVIGDFLARIFTSFEWLKDVFSLRWLIFVLFASFIIGAMIWRNADYGFLQIQATAKYFIDRPKEIPNMQKMNDQYWTAFLTLAMLNALILFFNFQEFFDIHQQSSNISASAMRFSVHFGTYILVFSILLAMGLLFYFFRNDLNFIAKSSLLQHLAYLWIVQNAIMVITVAIRNYIYISNYGLAYKRVGVIFFLLLTIFGLFSMILKIKDFRTFRNVLMLNGWSVYMAAILIACVNWDVYITRFNLAHTSSDRLDLRFLLQDVSDKNLFLLLEHRSQLPNKSYTESRWFGLVHEEYNVEQMLEQKKQNFLDRISNENRASFMSWNWIDEKNKAALGQ